jgi:hypothetical protein
MTRSSQQTYIQRLGFQDKDRSNVRHGLACEYLLNRLIESEWVSNPNIDSNATAVLTYFLKYNLFDFFGQDLEIIKKFLVDVIENKSYDINQIIEKIQPFMTCSQCVNVPIVSGKFVNGFADVVLPGDLNLSVSLNKQALAAGGLELEWIAYPETQHNFILGEIKITPEPAENIIQQIAFYRQYLHAKKVIILVDYDAPQLKRMTAGSDISVYRLGNAFEEWCAKQLNPEIDEF